MMRGSDGRDGLLVFWDSAEVPIYKLAEALRSAGLDSLVPSRPQPHMALRSALMDAAVEFQLKVHGAPIEYKPTNTADPELTCGFEAIRVVRSLSENSYPRLFTAETTPSGSVQIVRNDPTHGFNSSHQWQGAVARLVGEAAAEEFLSERYAHYMVQYPGSSVGALIRRAITRHLNGVALSRSGKAFYLPAASVGQYESLALHFRDETDGLRFGWFRWEKEEMGFEQILAALRYEITEVVGVVQQDLQNCTADGRKMRADARENRMTDLNDAHSKLLAYEQALGVSLVELKEGIEHTQGLLAMNALLAASA